MKNNLIKVSILAIGHLLVFDIYAGTVVLKNDVENKARFTITYRLYSPYFPDEFKLVEYKIEKIPQELKDLAKLPLDQQFNKLKTERTKLQTLLKNQIKTVDTSNVVLGYRKGLTDTSATEELMPIKKDKNGNKYIEVQNIKWQEEFRIPLKEQYFKNGEPKRITAITAIFSDENGEHILKMDDKTGWTDPCFIVKDYEKEEVEKDAIVEANVNLIKC